MKLRRLLLVPVVLGVLFSAAPQSDAATHKGKIQILQAPAWLGLLGSEGAGPDTVSGEMFVRACQADRAAGGKETPRINQFLASPFNGLDAFVLDLKKPTMGAFAVKGAGAKPVGPAVSGIQVTTYDLDLDFYVEASVDAARAVPGGCLDANEKATGNYSHKCYSHKPLPDEKTGCISGYKDTKGKMHGARYLMVSASLNLHGPMDLTITTP